MFSAYCPSGQQFDDSEPAECIDCERGYYKDNTVQYLFGECTMCDPDFITPDDGVAATSDGECTVSKCYESDRAWFLDVWNRNL